ncbi:hypothetical protein Sgou_39760 [Streptomyces gougerotii]|uniref:ABC transporter domain-containing protein n=3 Tax=Streptomyces TaxID=1883 RepID=A0A8H9LKI2_9ACTN|nr:hypothetical protein Sgou_39760 [Streptomyces gougerotii]GGU54423.1 hypothetical protein GCM10010227_04430 [Streptomyces gougerotii]
MTASGPEGRRGASPVHQPAPPFASPPSVRVARRRVSNREAAMSTIAPTCADLGFSGPGGTRVLDGFHLSVGPGRTGLTGDNGCGKSTLLKLAAGA